MSRPAVDIDSVGRPSTWAAPSRARRFAVPALFLLVSMVGSAVAQAVEHEVSSGETLSEIAESYGVSVNAIVNLNGLDSPDEIREGDVLLIPDPPYEGPVVIHEVAAGETLSEIAELYDVAMLDILQLNGIANADSIRVGDELEIPDPPNDEPFTVDTTYTVAEGDSLGLIAEEFNVTVASIMRANGLSNPDLVQLGDELVIPDIVPVDETELIDAYFEYWDEQYDIPTDLHKAIGWQESRWQPDAISSVGAMGIGQLMPYTVDFVTQDLIGEDLDPWDPEENIRMSAALFAFLLEETDGNIDMSIGAYYQGLTSVRRNGFFGETERYIASVKSHIERFATDAE